MNRLVAVFCAGVAAANGAHPILHWLEGGSLDAVLGYLNALAAQTSASVPGRLANGN